MTLRYIELDNGLRALLISDYSGPAASDDEDSDGEGEDGEEDQDADSGEGSEDESEGDDDDEQGSNDGGDDDDDDDEGTKKKGNAEKQVTEICTEITRNFKCTGFEFRVILIHNSISRVSQSAAALCVGVGSFSDPSDLPGLAHFLEHSEWDL